MKRPSETDWERLSAMSDEEIDTSDIPPLDEAFFARAKRRFTRKVSITVDVDADVLAWFKEKVTSAGGGNYQTLINQALREYIQQEHEPLEDMLRRVVREELQRSA
jgi:uncharacterized protein (DUF4415 family)